MSLSFNKITEYWQDLIINKLMCKGPILVYVYLIRR